MPSTNNSREEIKKPFIDLIKTIRKYRLREFGTLGVTSIPKTEIIESVLKDNVIKLFKGRILNKFDEADLEELKKLGYNGTDEDFNNYFIEHNYNNTDHYIFSTATKENIDKYLNKIMQSEEEIKQGEKYNKLVFEKKNGKWEFRYKGKRMWVRQNERTKSVSLNICLLMFGYPVTYITGNSIEGEEGPSIPNYQGGDKVHVGVLRELILIRGEYNYNPPPENDKFRPIRDAIGNINKSAQNKLGLKKIFKYSDQEVWVVI